MSEQRINYPPPQVEVSAARNVGSPRAPEQAASGRGDSTIEADFVEVGESRHSGFSLGGALNAVWSQAILPALEKLIPQGAAEIAQALNTGQAYVPYGPTETAVPIEPGSVFGSPEVAAAEPSAPQQGFGHQVFTPEAAGPEAYSYSQMMAEAAVAATHTETPQVELQR